MPEWIELKVFNDQYIDELACRNEADRDWLDSLVGSNSRLYARLLFKIVTRNSPRSWHKDYLHRIINDPNGPEDLLRALLLFSCEKNYEIHPGVVNFLSTPIFVHKADQPVRFLLLVILGCAGHVEATYEQAPEIGAEMYGEKTVHEFAMDIVRVDVVRHILEAHAPPSAGAAFG